MIGMLVTINTDASFHPQLKFGGYAFWAKSNHFKFVNSGYFKAKCENPSDAEARCIVNALTAVLSQNNGITKVIVNTDSTNAIAVLTNNAEIVNKFMGGFEKWRHITNPYNKLMANKEIQIEFRHVKAHSGVNNARSYVNEWCDMEAKRQMYKVAYGKQKLQKSIKESIN